MPDKSDFNLARIQRWMQSVITHPLGIQTGIESPLAQREIAIQAAEIEEVVCRSRHRSSIERLEVYGNAYYARLLECMREFFPATADALGVDVFDQFTLDYLQRHPSQSYTLGRLANQFVPFLEASRAQLENSDDRVNADETHWSDFFVDLARLEWSIDQVFDGPGVENEMLLTMEQLAEVGPERWPGARLLPVVCLKLLSSKYPVSDYYTAFRKQQQPAIPAAATTYLALTRRDYVVRRYAISEPQFALLQSLVDGEPVGSAIEHAAERVEDLDQFAETLQTWFKFWASQGFFQRVEP